VFAVWGATMTEPHPLRCETCKKHSETKYLSFCEGLAFRDNLDSAEKEYIKEWIERVGCASHSSTTTSAEKVLEQIVEYLEPKRESVLRTGGAGALGTFDGIIDYIKSLQQQERERG
jgi:hypothetical protein